MKCPNCGTENRDEVRFCRACGHPLADTAAGEATSAPPSEAPPQATGPKPPPSQTSGIICPTCGATAKFGARFCPRCGNAFQRSRDGASEGGAPAGGPSGAPAVPPDASAQGRPPSGTVPQMGSYTPPSQEQEFAEPAQAVPPPSEARYGGYETAPPPRQRSGVPKWVFWAGGGLALLAVVVIAAILLVGALRGNDAAPSEATPEVTDEAVAAPTATVEPAAGVEDPTPLPTEAPTLAPTPTTAMTLTDTPAPGGGIVIEDFSWEFDVAPNEPHVGSPIIVTVALVNNGSGEITIESYELVANGSPVLTDPLPLPMDKFSGFTDRFEGWPGLFSFRAGQPGFAEIQVRANVTLPDGTQQQVESGHTIEVQQ